MARARALAALLVGSWLVVPAARAQGGPPITVTSNADAGIGTLRDALASAGTIDRIVFAPGLAGQTITLTTTDSLTTTPSASPGPSAPFGPTALVVLGKDVTIDGSAAPGLTISAGDTQRIFAVTGAGGSARVRPRRRASSGS